MQRQGWSANISCQHLTMFLEDRRYMVVSHAYISLILCRRTARSSHSPYSSVAGPSQSMALVTRNLSGRAAVW